MLLKTAPQDNLPGVDTRLAPLQEWLESLPYTNTLAVCAQLQQRLHDINQQTLPAQKHFDLLVAFNSPFERVHESLRILDKSADPTLAPQLEALHQFTEEMLMGYKYVINHTLSEKSGWGKPKHLAAAINYAAHLLTLLLTGDWQRYQQTNEQYWYEASQLFSLAEDKKYPASTHSQLPQAEHPLSPLSSYPLIAMLRLADPYRMASEQVWDAFQYLQRHVNLVRMEPPAPETPLATNQFSLCLHCDPVEVMQYARSPEQPTPWKRLDAAELASQVQQDIKRLEAGSRARALGFSDRISTSEALQLLRGMLTQWQHNPERKLPRHQQTAPIELSPGLHTAFQLHNQGIAFDASDYLNADDNHEIDLSSLLSSSLEAHARQDVTIRCNSLNRSAGGLAIKIETAQAHLRVGELVTVTPNPDNPEHRLIGCIRWLVKEAEQGQIAGIQYIAKDVHPMAIRALDAGTQAPLSPALYYEFTQGDNHFELIITLRGMYRPGRMLELDDQGERLQRSCHHLIESNSLFERFTLNPDANS